ncbi:MAG: type III pantothenate kinase [Chlorobi bacterium CHB2]|nr:type III pantothenate kinase [Chlorobi bacterium CHB2]
MQAKPLFVEIGNSTIKCVEDLNARIPEVLRFREVAEFLERFQPTPDRPVVCAPIGEELSKQAMPHLQAFPQLRVVARQDLASFVGSSYDTPETLGLDRVLNLFGMRKDGIVVSCGTAITIDAIHGGRPYWGAIMPGFRTSTEGLHQRVPLLPVIDPDQPPEYPARTSIGSVTNGIVAGTAYGAAGIVGTLNHRLFGGSSKVILTGGDALLMRRLWESWAHVEVDEVLLFRGMRKTG